MFYPGSITQALQRSEQLAWPLLLFVADDTQVVDCLELIESASLETCTVLQLIHTGTEEHQQFQAFVKETETPRIHVFAPKKHRTGLPPMAIMGKNFNVTHVTEAVNIALEWSDGFTKELLQNAVRKVETMNNECARYWKLRDAEKMKASAPLFATANAVAPPAPSTTTSNNTTVRPSQTDARNVPHSQHNIHHYVELSVCDKISVVTQHEDAMTVASLWDMAVSKAKGEPSLKSSALAQLVVMSPDSDVRRHVSSRTEAAGILVKSLAPKTVVTATFKPAGEQTQQAAHAGHTSTTGEGKSHIHHYVELSVRDKVTVITQHESSASVGSLWDMAAQQAKYAGGSCADVVMQLVVTSPDSEVKTHLKSRNEASMILISSLAPKSVVTAVLASRDPNAPVPEDIPGIVCVGDQCMRVPRSAAPCQTASSASTGAAASAASTISVRCQLPTGAFIMASDLTPDSTLDDVRRVVAKHLGHDAFTIYNSYPPKRFADSDMTCSLRSLGLDRNATVRITMSASLQQPPPAAPSLAQPLGGVSGLLGASVGRLADMLRGVSGGSAGADTNTPSPSTAVPNQAHRSAATAPQPKRAAAQRFGTIASLHAADAQEGGDGHDDDEGDDPNRPRKSNRYYGGSSTEYEAKKK